MAVGVRRFHWLATLGACVVVQSSPEYSSIAHAFARLLIPWATPVSLWRKFSTHVANVQVIAAVAVFNGSGQAYSVAFYPRQVIGMRSSKLETGVPDGEIGPRSISARGLVSEYRLCADGIGHGR
ncbi:hypothetical protein GCM10028792_36120 [Salinisphaera aquimarina]